MNTFPHIQRGPSHVFSDEPSGKDMLIGDMASGYPLLNKIATFAPRTFSYELQSVAEINKLTIMQFYKDNKDVPFYWYNKQDSTTYEVAFISRPTCRMDGWKDLWRITINLLQTSP